ncbi:hypothetical protein DFO58_1197 [Arthrobacter sp. AG1021]|nr:hypothetical protein DFO58_1197 [Arthrobacter sp. AG1021]
MHWEAETSRSYKRVCSQHCAPLGNFCNFRGYITEASCLDWLLSLLQAVLFHDVS